MGKIKTKLSDYLKMFAINLIEDSGRNTRKQIIQDINNMAGKHVIGKMPSGILDYFKFIDG